MNTRNQKEGAIITLLVGLIASAVADAASQSGGGVQKRKSGQKRPLRRKYKKWV
jgi:hypothetical protein